MTDKPMIFSAPMVRALLDGRKTQTRRIWKPQPEYLGEYGGCEDLSEYGWLDEDGSFLPAEDIKPNGLWIGDRIWVRETWKPGAWREDGRVAVDYKASPELTNTPWMYPPESVWEDLWINVSDELREAGSIPDEDGFHHWDPGKSPLRWRSPIHMPRWASRLTMILTDVRVQRLQEISEEDAKAEGARLEFSYPGWDDVSITPWYRWGFHELWDSINAKRGYGWDKNPWVAAISFEVHKRNIDDLPREVAA